MAMASQTWMTIFPMMHQDGVTMMGMVTQTSKTMTSFPTMHQGGATVMVMATQTNKMMTHFQATQMNGETVMGTVWEIIAMSSPMIQINIQDSAISGDINATVNSGEEEN
jgi:hypothetical protein